MTPHSNPDSRVIAVTPDLIEIAGDGNAAIFLAQVLFWWRVTGRRKFYKFNSPCDHAMYRPGDSWAEELRLKRAMFATARRRVATKVRISSVDEIQSAFGEGALVVYGTDEHHLTWYVVNEEAVQQRSPSLYGRLFRQESALSQASSQQEKAVTTPAKKGPDQTGSTAGRATPVLAAAVPLHSPMPSSTIGNPTEKTSEKASEISLPAIQSSVNTPLPTPPTVAPEGEGGEASRNVGGVSSKIFEGLQQRGVQDDPARMIATRAARSGYTVDEALDIFDAHILDAERANALSPVGVAVSRMSKNSSITPAPARALEKVRRRRHAGNAVPCHDVGRANPTEHQALWENVLRDIKLQLTRATFDTQLRGTTLEREGSRYVICTANPHAVEWLDHRLNRLVKQCLQQHIGAEVQLAFAHRATV